MCTDLPRRPLAVLHVLGRIGADRGGSSAAVFGSAVATRDAGDRATVLTTRGADERLPDVPDDVEIVACRRAWPHHVAFSASLVTWLWRNVRRFDVVEVHEVFAFPTPAVWLTAGLRRVPFVIHPHGSLDPHDLRKHAHLKTVLRPGVRRMVRRSAGVWLATTQEEAGAAHLVGGVRTVVSPVPVVPAEHAGDGAGFRARHRLADDDRVVLYLGRLDPAKGLFRLLTAFETVADTLDRARLVIAGTGDAQFSAALRERVASSRHAGAIRVVGFLSGREKADAFAGADLFALHSDNESFGIAPVEAVRAGTPVLLSSTVHVAGELVAAGAAESVGVHDTSGLARRLGGLLGDPAALRAMAAATDAAAAPYHPSRAAQRDACLRRDLLDGARTPGRTARRAGDDAGHGPGVTPADVIRSLSVRRRGTPVDQVRRERGLPPLRRQGPR